MTSMTIDEYVEMRKKHLEDFLTKFKEEHKKEPENWPLIMKSENDVAECEWYEQELSFNTSWAED